MIDRNQQRSVQLRDILTKLGYTGTFKLFHTVDIAVDFLNRFTDAMGDFARADIIFLTYELQGSNLKQALD